MFEYFQLKTSHNFRLFGGLIQDIKRKVPFYLSDFKDALHVQCLASTIFMYFACLTPIVTFGGLLGTATDNYMVRGTSIALSYKNLDDLPDIQLISRVTQHH